MLYELLKNTFYLLFTHHQPLYCESIASSAIAFSQRGLETHLLLENMYSHEHRTFSNSQNRQLLNAGIQMVTLFRIQVKKYCIFKALESIFYEPGCNSPHLQDSFHLDPQSLQLSKNEPFCMYSVQMKVSSSIVCGKSLKTTIHSKPQYQELEGLMGTIWPQHIFYIDLKSCFLVPF